MRLTDCESRNIDVPSSALINQPWGISDMNTHDTVICQEPLTMPIDMCRVVPGGGRVRLIQHHRIQSVRLLLDNQHLVDVDRASVLCESWQVQQESIRNAGLWPPFAPFRFALDRRDMAKCRRCWPNVGRNSPMIGYHGTAISVVACRQRVLLWSRTCSSDSAL